MPLTGSGSTSRAMTGANRPLRFKLSLSFLNRKKKRKNFLEEEDVNVPCDTDQEGTHLPETGLGDLLQDIAEENEDQLQENGNFVDDTKDETALGDVDGHPEQNYEENVTLALVPKSLSLLELQNDSSIVNPSMTYKSFDIVYPPGGSPPSRRRTERSSSMKAFDASTRSDSLRTESVSTQMSTGGHSRGGRSWLSTRCGFRSCSKQIDMEAELRSKDRAAHRERNRSHRSRAKSSHPAAWESDTVSEWSVLAAVEKDVARKKSATRKKKGHKKSSKLAPSPGLGISPSQGVRAATPEMKCSLRDAYEEVREAANYDLPSQRSDQQGVHVEVDGSGGSRNMLDTSTDMDGNTGEDRVHPWERSFSSPSSDDELFTTSFELEGKPRRKKWSSNSSDETEGRHRRPGPAGSHVRSKSTWSNHSVRGVVQEEEIDDDHKESGKKGSRIIFLSTPPRPEDLGMDEDEPSTNDQILLKSSSDRFGEYSKLEPGVQIPHFDRTFSVGYKSNQTPVSFETDMEANAKAWSKLDVRTSKGDGSFSDVSVREVPMVSGSKEPRKHRSRHIDVQIEDQLVNLRLESDVSDSSQGKSYIRSRGKMFIKKCASKALDQEKPSKKKRVAHSRRRRGRKPKVPPPLPSDLHGKVKESVAVVKSSYDPYTDFRDSMVEMIVEKEIQGATDLEELLRCYLSLNSAEYHSVIVKVFADVWRELFADAI